MRAAVLDGIREVRVEERPVPRPAAGEVLVQIGSVGVCGSDVHYYEHGRIGGHVVEQPLVLGHEAGGRVVAVGDGVPVARVGERVSVEPGIPCGRCRECRTGRYNLCSTVRFLATPPVDGAFCGYLAVPSDFAHAVPDSISDDAAGLLEPLSVAIWAHHKAGTGAGASVLVSGAGPIGLLVVAVARAIGATTVVATDVDPGRRELARRHGATDVLDPVPAGALDGVEVDAFVDCSGVEAAVLAGLEVVRPAGTAVLVGMGADRLALPVPLVQNRELRVTGTFRYAHTWPTAIGLAASGAVDLDSLVTGAVGLDDVASALAPDPADRHVKIMVRPGD
ncbi:MAG: NAD(P)-dependent alcohol dehydrogenase [Actinomycetota bacterium]|nr:NAD(P)-dependent alcohol dehydrogenase [Actinomycetota bacterium]